MYKHKMDLNIRIMKKWTIIHPHQDGLKICNQFGLQAGKMSRNSLRRFGRSDAKLVVSFSTTVVSLPRVCPSCGRGRPFSWRRGRSFVGRVWWLRRTWLWQLRGSPRTPLQPRGPCPFQTDPVLQAGTPQADIFTGIMVIRQLTYWQRKFIMNLCHLKFLYPPNKLHCRFNTVSVNGAK